MRMVATPTTRLSTKNTRPAPTNSSVARTAAARAPTDHASPLTAKTPAAADVSTTTPRMKSSCMRAPCRSQVPGGPIVEARAPRHEHRAAGREAVLRTRGVVDGVEDGSRQHLEPGALEEGKRPPHVITVGHEQNAPDTARLEELADLDGFLSRRSRRAEQDHGRRRHAALPAQVGPNLCLRSSPLLPRRPRTHQPPRP